MTKKELEPITPEQEQLAQDNHPLIYSFLKKHNLPEDEFYDIVAIGFMKAVRAFDSNRGIKFATFAYRCMRSEWLLELRIRKQKPLNYITLSLDMPIGDDTGEHEAVLGDTVPNENTEDSFHAVEIDEFYETARRRLAYLTNQRYADECLKAWQLHQAGYTQREIGLMCNVTQSAIKRRLDRILAIMHKEIES